MANTNIGIKQVGCYIPQNRIDTFELGSQLDAKEDFIRDKLGFTELAKKSAEESTSDLCVRAYQDLLQKCGDIAPEIGCVMVVTQNPDTGGIPHTSAVVHQKLGLIKQVACCDISLGCTGFVHALSVITGFMREAGIQNGLLFTADPYSMVIDPNDRDTAMLFGDAATCSLIGSDPIYKAGKSRFVTDSKFNEAIKTASTPDRTLSMKGSEVFRFVAKNVPREIKACLKDNELQMADVDRFLIHQGSKFIVETLAGALKIKDDKMQFAAGKFGNTISSSIPMLLADVLSEKELPQTILAAGFGVGLSSFVSVLNRTT